MTTHDQNPHGLPNPVEPDSTETGSGSNPAWKTHVKSTTQAVWREARQIAIVTLRHIQRWTTLAWVEAQRRACLWRLNRQKVIVGEQMYDNGFGDDRLRERISELDRSIEQATADKKPTRQVAQRRRAVVMQLANSTPTQPTAAVAAEMQKLQSLENQLAELEDSGRRHRETPSPNHGEWTRIGVGYGVMLLLVVLGCGWLLRGSSGETIAENNDSAVILADSGEASGSKKRSGIDSSEGEHSQIENEQVSKATEKEAQTSDDSGAVPPKMLTADEPPRPPSTYDSEPDVAFYRPVVVSRPHGQNHIVTTEKMPLDDGLFLTVSFFVIHPDEPGVRHPPDGVAVAGVVMLENLVTTHDHNLTSRTRLRIARGALPAFEVESPKEKWVNDRLKALDYGGYSPLNLLYYLRGEGRITVEVDGDYYPLSASWREHLSEALEETRVQRNRMGL